ncbi:MAG TPA: glycosyltransferase, partial [Chloroflexi bacterium]|nr:glycosyltransferase [Chloroflexota bacterium]
IGGLAARWLLPGVPSTYGAATARWGGTLALAGGLTLLQRDAARWRAAVLTFVAFDLLLFGWPAVPTVDRALYQGKTEAAGLLRAGTRLYWPTDPGHPASEYDAEYRIKFDYLAFDSFGPRDVDYWWGMREDLLPNAGMLDEVASANNFDPLLVGWYADLLEAVVEAPALLRVMGVTHVASDRAWPSGEWVHAGGSAVLYRLLAGGERAWVVPTARQLPLDETLAALADAAFDPTAQVLLNVPVSESSPAAADIPCEIALQDTPNGVTIRANLDAPGYLVLADTWYPGWQATVDGAPAKLLRANYAFRAVWLEAGTHLVRMVYRPASVFVGAGVSMVALAVVVGGLLLTRRRGQEGRSKVPLRAEGQVWYPIGGRGLLVTVIIPTYNEKENIETLVAQLLALPTQVQVLVVDDNSPDGTGDIADRLAVESGGRVSVVHRAGKLGLGTAYIVGFQRALADGADLVCTMDADFSHNPRYVPAMVDKIETGCDLVIGSRYVRGGGATGCTFDRVLLSWGANGFARVMLGLHAHDTTAGFRCYRREVLESIGLEEIKASGYSFLIEMLYRVQRQGYRVGEVPIIFENRRLGTSKISQDEVLRAMMTVLRLAWGRVMGSR